MHNNNKQQSITQIEPIDISLPVTLGLAATLYPTLLALFPKPSEIYGPQGPLWPKAGQPFAPPVTQGTPEAA